MALATDEMSSTDPADDAELLQEAKLRALAEFAAGAGHEINNPLASIIGYAQQLLAGETDPDRRHMLATIGAQAYRIRDMIGDVMLFARPPEPKPVVEDLSRVASEVAAKFSTEIAERRIEFCTNLSPDVPILADPVQLRVVISNILRNSLEAVEAGGSIAVSSAAVIIDGDLFAEFVVTDNGRGLSEKDREHLFDPFYSGRQAGRGLGFGLSKCWRIVTLHGGQIRVDSPAGGGAICTILWPADSEPASPPQPGS